MDLYLLRILRDYTPKSVCCLLIPHVRSYSDISCDKYDTKFRTYLAGLIEGDGYIGPKGITILNHANDVLNTIFINKRIKIRW